MNFIGQDIFMSIGKFIIIFNFKIKTWATLPLLPSKVCVTID